MLEKPGAAELLANARDVLLQELLPNLPEPMRFQARMIANAMGIAERELGASQAKAGSARAALEVAMGPGPDGGDGRLRELAKEIRTGQQDPGTVDHAVTARLLREYTRFRCSVSAPRSLLGRG